MDRGSMPPVLPRLRALIVWDSALARGGEPLGKRQTYLKIKAAHVAHDADR
jgi:hypothetical protein